MAARLPVIRLRAVCATIFGLLCSSDVAAQSRTVGRDTAKYEVRKIEFTGNRLLEDDELEAVVQTENTRCKSLLLTPACLVTNWNLVKDRRYLDALELARDAVRIRIEYFLRGYREAAVDTIVRRDRGLARVTFAIDEGEPLRITSLAVTRPPNILTDKQVDELVPTGAGAPLDLLRLDTAKVRLREALWDRGYSDAIVNIDTTREGGGMRVEFEVDPRWVSKVSRIQVTGNRKIGDETIKNSLFLSEGDVFRLSEMLRSQRALYESRLFRRATVDAATLDDSLKVVLVDVTESALREARLGAGISTVDFLQLDGQFTNFNWNGGARRVTVNLTIGNLLAKELNGKAIFRDALDGIDVEGSAYLSPTWRASGELRIPWFNSPRNDVSFTAFAQRRSLPGIFVDRSLGFGGVFTREVSQNVPVSLGYRFEVTRVEAGDLYFCANFGLCDPPTVAALRSAQRMSPITISSTIERTDDPIDATKGISLHAELEHASSYTFSDYRFNRILVDAAVFQPVLYRSVIALHARAGWVAALGSTDAALGVDVQGRSILHPRKRFFAGGSQSVRGFGEGQLGPRILTVPQEQLVNAGCEITADSAVCREELVNDRTLLPDSIFTARPLGGNLLLEGSAEFRFPILGAFTGALFVDGALVGESGLSDLSQSTVAITPGLGFRYKSAAGPIRIDLGYNPFLTEDLPVVTEVDDAGSRRIAELQIQRQIDNQLAPARRTFSPRRSTGFLGFLSQFTLHLSIGQAF